MCVCERGCEGARVRASCERGSTEIRIEERVGSYRKGGRYLYLWKSGGSDVAKDLKVSMKFGRWLVCVAQQRWRGGKGSRSSTRFGSAGRRIGCAAWCTLLLHSTGSHWWSLVTDDFADKVQRPGSSEGSHPS